MNNNELSQALMAYENAAKYCFELLDDYSNSINYIEKALKSRKLNFACHYTVNESFELWWDLDDSSNNFRVILVQKNKEKEIILKKPFIECNLNLRLEYGHQLKPMLEYMTNELVLKLAQFKKIIKKQETQ